MKRHKYSRKIPFSFNSFFKINDSVGRRNFSNIALHVMPIGNTKIFFSADLIGTEEEKEKAYEIINAISRFSRERGIDFTAREVIRNISDSLIYFGNINYEITVDSENFSSLYLVDNDKMFYVLIFNSFIGKFFNIYRKKYFWRIKIPNKLGGIRKHRKILKDLSRFDVGQLNSSFLENSHKPNEILTNSYSLYGKAAELYHMKLTNKWGWMRHNDYLDTHCTLVFAYYKMLTIRWSAAVLREHIIQEINNLFKHLKIECKLEVNGLATSARILDLRDGVCDGSVNFKEALKEASTF